MTAQLARLRNVDGARGARERGKLRIAIIGGRSLCRLCLRTLFAQLLRTTELVEIADVRATQDLTAACGNSDLLLYSAVCPQDGDLEALEALSLALPGIPIVVHTDSLDPPFVDGLVERGVTGIIPTSSTGDVAIAALRLVAAGGTYMPAGLVHGLPGAEGRIEPRKAPPSGLGLLTRREAQVFDLVAKGMTNKEAAHRLELAVPTIKVHLQNIFRKLQVKNRTQLAHLAARLKP